jgi:hypothetical protein
MKIKCKNCNSDKVFIQINDFAFEKNGDFAFDADGGRLEDVKYPKNIKEYIDLENKYEDEIYEILMSAIWICEDCEDETDTGLNVDDYIISLIS